jgi:hypothetical protein
VRGSPLLRIVAALACTLAASAAAFPVRAEVPVAGTETGASLALRVPDGLRPGSPAVPLAELDPEVAAGYSGVALVEAGGGCSGVLLAPGAGSPPADAPAYVLTNGHCIDLLSPTAVLLDAPGDGSVRFGWSGGPAVESAIGRVAWATMKGTDLALIELETPLADLLASGVRAYPIGPVPPEPGSRAVVVGGPSPVDGGDRRLMLTVCGVGKPHDLLEHTWTWFGFPDLDCADIRPGSSGSPLLDPSTGALVGLVNTSTAGSEALTDCAFNRPCEVTTAGAVSRPDTAYGPRVADLAGCFDAAWRFLGPGGTCPLDPGSGLSVEGATVTTNPDRPSPSGDPPPTGWGAHLRAVEPDIAWYRMKTGVLGAVDCRDPEDYGPPVSLASRPLIARQLPRDEGRYQLCLLAGRSASLDGGWSDPRFADVLTASVDRTPPRPPVELRIEEDRAGWRIEPGFMWPELSAFAWKAGIPERTDCLDPSGYAVYDEGPISLARTLAPTRLCVIGYDDANNPTPPAMRLFEP